MPDEPRIRELFFRASELPEGEREAFVRGAAASEAEAERVLQLLRRAATQTDILERPVAALFEQVARESGGRIAEFELLERIGAGGMGVVFRARDTKLGRDVAIKVLAPHLATSQQARGKLLDEAKAAAKLQHPNIVPVYKCDSDGGVDYIVSEYIRGTTVAAELQAERARRGSSEDTAGTRNWRRRCTEWAAAVADALETAHRAGIVHRDVKPSNILLDEQGRPRLTDFGIALDMTEETLTAESTAVGTCFYMSPEQAAAASARVDHRSDIYSLGVVLYEMLSLQRPFEGSNVAAVLQAVLLSDPPPLRKRARGIPRDLETICAKAMRRNPVERYQTAGHLSADLRSYLAGDPILARPEGLVRRWARWFLRQRFAAVIGAACLLAVALLLVFWQNLRQRDAGLAHFSVSAAGMVCRVYLQSCNTPNRHPEREFQDLGATPLSSVKVACGQYRVTIVRTSDAAFCEFNVLLLEPGADRGVRLRVVDATDTAAHRILGTELLGVLYAAPNPDDSAMLHVDSGSYRLKRDADSDSMFQDATPMDAFLIDRTEVSNSEYKAFVDATGHSPPYFWKAFGYSDAIADLPVCWVTLADAEAYARWRGKRLPTLLEWHAAARGKSGDRYPGSDELSPAMRPSTSRPAAMNPRALFDSYLASAVPTRQAAPCDPAMGLLHTFSNVRELTATVHVPDRNVFVAGRGWLDPVDAMSLTWVLTAPASSPAPSCGFRCARSVLTKGARSQ